MQVLFVPAQICCIVLCEKCHSFSWSTSTACSTLKRNTKNETIKHRREMLGKILSSLTLIGKVKDFICLYDRFSL